MHLTMRYLSVHYCQNDCIVGEMTINGEDTFSFVSVVCRHHIIIYFCISVHPETGNNHDKYAVSVLKHTGIVSHVNYKQEVEHVKIMRLAVDMHWLAQIKVRQ